MSSFTPELGDFICERLWEGATLPQIEREWREKSGTELKINRQRTWEWCKANPEWGERYREAMVEGGLALLEANVDIADDREDDPASRKVRIHAREQLAARKDPKRCSDRKILAGDPDAPVVVQAIERRIVRPE